MPTSTRAQALWEPSPERQQQAALTQYLRWLRERRGLAFADYDELHRWSVSDLEGFWGSIWDYFEVEGTGPYERVLAERQMPGASGFRAPTQLRGARPPREARRAVAIVHASELGAVWS